MCQCVFEISYSLYYNSSKFIRASNVLMLPQQPHLVLALLTKLIALQGVVLDEDGPKRRPALGPCTAPYIRRPSASAARVSHSGLDVHS